MNVHQRPCRHDAGSFFGVLIMMNLYSGTTCPFSHRCRIVLYEKEMDFQVIDVDLFNKPEDIAVINPYNRVPVLVDRDLDPLRAEHHQRVHRRALPASATDAARSDHACPRAPVADHAWSTKSFRTSMRWKRTCKTADKARQIIRDRLTELAPVFAKQKHMLGDDFSMLDVAIAPLLWRLDHYGIELPKTAAPLMKYAERIFSRQGFIDALTPSEKVMRR